jgi:predicted Zn-dependent protease
MEGAMVRGVKYIPLLFGLGLLARTVVSPAPASAQLGMISRSEEIRLGQEAAQQMEAKYPTHRDRRVEAIGMDLVRANNLPDYPYRFRVIDQNDVNAVSLPGGPVYVFGGLLRAVGSDDDALAGVIAHELGHIKERHAVKQMEKQSFASMLLGGLTHGRMQGLASIVTNIGLLKFSRNDEYQADDDGVQFAARAGYDPEGLIRFFQKLQRIEGSSSRGVSWLQTHPSSSKRIRRIQARVDSLEGRRER